MNVYVAAMLRNSYAAVASHRNPLAGIEIAVVNKLPAPYRAALGALRDLGLSGSSTLYDIGARWTELDITLRVEGEWKGRYIPIDLSLDLHHDLESWSPPRPADYRYREGAPDDSSHPCRRRAEGRRR